MDFSLGNGTNNEDISSDEIPDDIPDDDANARCYGFSDLPHDIILQILFFNLDHKEMVRVKRLNKQCYKMLNPNDPVVNMLWECITRHAFPFMASILKCRRWDLYFKFRTQRIRQIQRAGSTHSLSDSVCDK